MFFRRVLQSTSLLRGKTPWTLQFEVLTFNASIHFPLAREDQSNVCPNDNAACFNPLPSCEGRQELQGPRVGLEQLQSTSLLRGKTVRVLLMYSPSSCFNPLPSCEGRHATHISINALRCFNPLPSCEGRHAYHFFSDDVFMLQSTSLLRGKTANFTKNCPLLFYNLVCFHHTISYYFYSRYEFRCYLFIISSF